MIEAMPSHLTLISCLLLLTACGARSRPHRGARDGSVSAETPCPALRGIVGRYEGSWLGVVNCLEEKHPSSGQLSFRTHVEGAGLRLRGTFTGTFSNGQALKSTINGVVPCGGATQIDLEKITVGTAHTAKLTGWLKGFVPAAYENLTGTWRVDQWKPLCIGAGSWKAQRKGF